MVKNRLHLVTSRRATQLVTAAGLHSVQWHRLSAVIIQAVTATK